MYVKPEEEETKVMFVMDRFGYAKTIDLAAYERNKDTVDTEFKVHFVCSNLGRVCVFTDTGMMHTVKVSDLPMAKLKEKGRPIDNVCKFDSAKENVIYITNQSELNLYRLVFVTAQGYVKIVSGGEFDVTRLTIQATKLDEDDRLVMAGAITDQQNIVLRTQEGFFLKYSLEEIPEQKKTARGVRGIRLSAKDEVEDAWILNPNVPNTIAFHDREIDLNHFKSTARGGKGTRK